MNALGLLEHFDRLIDTPDAVPRLRRFILDLAVRGKLVEQDPKDEPAGELLKRIQTEKTRLVKAGEIRKERPLPPVDEDTTPFGLPSLWEWASIRQITTDRGQKIPEKKFSYVDVSAINKERGEIADLQILTPDAAPSRARKIVKKGDVIYSCVRPNLLNIAVVEKDFNPEPIVSTAFAVLNGFGLIHPRYLWIVLRSPFFVECVEGKMRGQAYPAINDADFAPLSVPLPPLAEQTRIVAKVDELMALCDELEAAQTKRERRRDSLVAATLHGLNDGDATPTPGAPSTFEESARFYFNHLPRLTTRPEHIHQLRQTILNLAVRGKLVPQDPKDEPSSRLLVRLSRGKERIVEELGLRQQPELSEDVNQVVPFHAPAAWARSIVDECFIVTGGIQKTPLRTPRNNAYPYVGVSNVYRGRLDLSEIRQFELREGELEKLRLEPDDLLVVEGNGSASEVGRCARWTGEIRDCVHQNHIIRCRAGDPAIARFTEIYLNSETGVEIMRALAVTSAGLYNLSVGKIRRIQIPIPPLAEQHRIVAKVDELMVLCDELGARIASIFRTNWQLLKVVIEEALPGD